MAQNQIFYNFFWRSIDSNFENVPILGHMMWYVTRV